MEDLKKQVEELEEELQNELEGHVDNPEDTSADLENTENEEEKDEKDLDNQRIPYDRFKQKVDEVNRLKKILDEKEAEEKAAKIEALKEQDKYKELYETVLEELEDIKSSNVQNVKAKLLKEAGYKEEQVERLSKLVDGDTEEEILASIDDLQVVFPTKTYVDPSPDNRKRTTPEPVDGEDIGKSMFDRLLKSGKLKGFKN